MPWRPAGLCHARLPPNRHARRCRAPRARRNLPWTTVIGTYTQAVDRCYSPDGDHMKEIMRHRNWCWWSAFYLHRQCRAPLPTCWRPLAACSDGERRAKEGFHPVWRAGHERTNERTSCAAPCRRLPLNWLMVVDNTLKFPAALPHTDRPSRAQGVMDLHPFC